MLDTAEAMICHTLQELYSIATHCKPLLIGQMALFFSPPRSPPKCLLRYMEVCKFGERVQISAKMADCFTETRHTIRHTNIALVKEHFTIIIPEAKRPKGKLTEESKKRK